MVQRARENDFTQEPSEVRCVRGATGRQVDPVQAFLGKNYQRYSFPRRLPVDDLEDLAPLDDRQSRLPTEFTGQRSGGPWPVAGGRDRL